jgi:hypothetical protein
MKKDGGKISHWQIHNLNVPEDMLQELKRIKPDICVDPNPMMITGNIVDDPTGRWEKGFHFRSTLICKIDRENHTIETENTIYKYDPDTEGQDTFKDLGNGVLKIFY